MNRRAGTASAPRTAPAAEPPDDGLNPARGFKNALAFVLPFWAAAGLALWLLRAAEGLG